MTTLFHEAIGQAKNFEELDERTAYVKSIYDREGWDQAPMRQTANERFGLLERKFFEPTEEQCR
jgi:hypothetical protein